MVVQARPTTRPFTQDHLRQLISRFVGGDECRLEGIEVYIHQFNRVSKLWESVQTALTDMRSLQVCMIYMYTF